jgi:DNA-binding GntR family transcriptional regulator
MELRRLGDQLDTLFARVREREDDRDLFYAVQENHTNLHLRIAECSRCVQLKKAIEQNHVLIYNWFFDSSTRGRFLPPRFHQDLMEKVTGDDPDAAEEAMRLHVRFGLASVVEQLAGTTASSDWRRKRKEPQ